MRMRTLILRAVPVLAVQAACLAGEAPVSLLADPALDGGFRLSAVSVSDQPVETGVILAADPGAPACWRLAQWGTRWNLASAPDENAPGGSRSRRNEGKRIAVLPGGLAGDGVVLAVNGPAEYPDGPRKQGQPWPHLLVEQRLSAGTAPAEFASLPFKVSFRVDRCDAPEGAALDPGLHTAQITAYWTAQNSNRASAGFGDMLWFGVPLFDARHPVPPGHQAEDTGQPGASHKFIYTVDGARVLDSLAGMGQWRAVSCDILPMLRAALDAALEKGFMTGTGFSDLTLTSFNLGWEVPGPYTCEITLRGLEFSGVRAGGGAAG